MNFMGATQDDEDFCWDEAPDDEHERTAVPRGFTSSSSAQTPSAHLRANCQVGARNGEGEGIPTPMNRSWVPPMPRGWEGAGLPQLRRGPSTQDVGPDAQQDQHSATSKLAMAAAALGFPTTAAMCGRSPQALFQTTKADAQEAQRMVNLKEKCRTLKYYPPPGDDTDIATVDVIDHGSEVLIVRRDPSPLRGSPPTSVLLGSSPGGPGGTAAARVGGLKSPTPQTGSPRAASQAQTPRSNRRPQGEAQPHEPSSRTAAPPPRAAAAAPPSPGAAAAWPLLASPPSPKAASPSRPAASGHQEKTAAPEPDAAQAAQAAAEPPLADQSDVSL